MLYECPLVLLALRRRHELCLSICFPLSAKNSHKLVIARNTTISASGMLMLSVCLVSRSRVPSLLHFTSSRLPRQAMFVIHDPRPRVYTTGSERSIEWTIHDMYHRFNSNNQLTTLCGGHQGSRYSPPSPPMTPLGHLHSGVQFAYNAHLSHEGEYLSHPFLRILP